MRAKSITRSADAVDPHLRPRDERREHEDVGARVERVHDRDGAQHRDVRGELAPEPALERGAGSGHRRAGGRRRRPPRRARGARGCAAAIATTPWPASTSAVPASARSTVSPRPIRTNWPARSKPRSTASPYWVIEVGRSAARTRRSAHRSAGSSTVSASAPAATRSSGSEERDGERRQAWTRYAPARRPRARHLARQHHREPEARDALADDEDGHHERVLAELLDAAHAGDGHDEGHREERRQQVARRDEEEVPADRAAHTAADRRSHDARAPRRRPRAAAGSPPPAARPRRSPCPSSSESRGVQPSSRRALSTLTAVCAGMSWRSIPWSRRRPWVRADVDARPLHLEAGPPERDRGRQRLAAHAREVADVLAPGDGRRAVHEEGLARDPGPLGGDQHGVDQVVDVDQVREPACRRR